MKINVTGIEDAILKSRIINELNFSLLNIKKRYSIDLNLTVHPRIKLDIKHKDLHDLYEPYIKAWEVDLVALCVKNRSGNLPLYRQMLWFIARKAHPKTSLINIAKSLGCTNHCTVIRAYDTIRAYMFTKDQKFLTAYEKIQHLPYAEIFKTN